MVARWLPIFFFGIVLVSIASNLNQILASETIYKWVDEKGVTHYSESPPSQGKSKPIEIQTGPATSVENTGTPAGKTWQQEELEFQQRQRGREAAASEEEAKRQAARTAESEMRRKCAAARARIALLQLQRRGPAPTRNEKGETEWWNFEQRGIEINELGRFIDQNCAAN